MGRKLLGDLEQALNAGAGILRHVTWFVSYHMGGRAHDDESSAAEPRSGTAEP